MSPSHCSSCSGQSEALSQHKCSSLTGTLSLGACRPDMHTQPQQKASCRLKHKQQQREQAELQAQQSERLRHMTPRQRIVRGCSGLQPEALQQLLAEEAEPEPAPRRRKSPQRVQPPLELKQGPITLDPTRCSLPPLLQRAGLGQWYRGYALVQLLPLAAAHACRCEGSAAEAGTRSRRTYPASSARSRCAGRSRE